MTLDLNIWWSVPQFAPRIVRVLQMSIPDDGRSGMSICIVVHVMKAACKYVEVLLAFAGYQQHSLGGLTVVLHRQECIQTDVDH